MTVIPPTPPARPTPAFSRLTRGVGYVRAQQFEVSVFSPRQYELSKYIKERPKVDASKVVLSPMPGSVVSVAVKAGDKVRILHG